MVNVWASFEQKLFYTVLQLGDTLIMQCILQLESPTFLKDYLLHVFYSFFMCKEAWFNWLVCLYGVTSLGQLGLDSVNDTVFLSFNVKLGFIVYLPYEH